MKGGLPAASVHKITRIWLPYPITGRLNGTHCFARVGGCCGAVSYDGVHCIVAAGWRFVYQDAIRRHASLRHHSLARAHQRDVCLPAASNGGGMARVRPVSRHQHYSRRKMFWFHRHHSLSLEMTLRPGVYAGITRLRSSRPPRNGVMTVVISSSADSDIRSPSPDSAGDAGWWRHPLASCHPLPLPMSCWLQPRALFGFTSPDAQQAFFPFYLRPGTEPRTTACAITGLPRCRFLRTTRGQGLPQRSAPAKIDENGKFFLTWRRR